MEGTSPTHCEHWNGSWLRHSCWSEARDENIHIYTVTRGIRLAGVHSDGEDMLQVRTVYMQPLASVQGDLHFTSGS